MKLKCIVAHLQKCYDVGMEHFIYLFMFFGGVGVGGGILE